VVTTQIARGARVTNRATEAHTPLPSTVGREPAPCSSTRTRSVPEASYRGRNGQKAPRPVA
jgi:hypothetical protein